MSHLSPLSYSPKQLPCCLTPPEPLPSPSPPALRQLSRHPLALSLQLPCCRPPPLVHSLLPKPTCTSATCLDTLPPLPSPFAPLLSFPFAPLSSHQRTCTSASCPGSFLTFWQNVTYSLSAPMQAAAVSSGSFGGVPAPAAPAAPPAAPATGVRYFPSSRRTTERVSCSTTAGWFSTSLWRSARGGQAQGKAGRGCGCVNTGVGHRHVVSVSPET